MSIVARIKMMILKQVFTLIPIITFALSASAQISSLNKLAKQNQDNCHIEVTYNEPGLPVEMKKQTFRVKSRKECESFRKMLETNPKGTPKAVKAKILQSPNE